MHSAHDGVVHAGGEQREPLAAIHHHFAAEQIERLDTVRAFVNHV